MTWIGDTSLDFLDDFNAFSEAPGAAGIVWHKVKSPKKSGAKACASLVPAPKDFEADETETVLDDLVPAGPDAAFEAIIGDDDRQAVTNASFPPLGTRGVPFRWICSVNGCTIYPKSLKKNPTLHFGSGTLIGPRHVLTAAHVLFNFASGAKNKRAGPFWKDAIVVTPGRDGTRDTLGTRRPFGFAYARRIGVTREWFLRLSGNKTPPQHTNTKARQIINPVREFDYGLIELDRPIGNRRFGVLGGRQLGYWGSPTDGFDTGLGLDRSASFFNRVPVNLCGYPADKCRGEPPKGSLTKATQAACRAKNRFDRASAQWLTFERVLRGAVPGTPGLMSYEHDTKGGHSGAPVWIRWRNRRSLIGVHGGILVSGASNRGIRITPQIAARIRSWMR